MLKARFVHALLFVLPLAPIAAAQGETCSNPVALSGLGVFPFDTSGFADSGFDEAQACNPFTGPGEYLNGDGFFTWTAPFSGDFQLVAEGRNANGFTWGTQMAIYDGQDCSAPCLANDDNTGPGSAAMIGLLGVAAGDSFLIQIGGYDFFNNGNQTTYQGLGTLVIEERPLQCQNPQDDGFEDNDGCTAAIPLGEGVHPNLFLSVEDPDYYSMTIPAGSALRVEPLSSDLELAFFVYNDQCQLIDIVYGTWIRDNPGASPEPIIVQPRRVNWAPAIPCTQYALELSIDVDPCQNVVDDMFEDNDFSNTPAPIANGYYPGLWITSELNFGSILEVDYYSCTLPHSATGRFELRFDHGLADVNAYLLNPNGNFLALGVSNDDDESLEWTNTTGLPMDVRLYVFVAEVGTQSCNTYDLVVSGIEGRTGLDFCDPLPNSTGLDTRLSGVFGTGVGSDLHLDVRSGPPGEFGYFLVGTMNASPGVPLASGQFCLIGQPGAQFFRYNVQGGEANSIGQFDGSGVLQNLVQTSTLGDGFDVPSQIPGGGVIVSGSTWHFQFWHRDTMQGAMTANFSNGLSVQF